MIVFQGTVIQFLAELFRQIMSLSYSSISSLYVIYENHIFDYFYLLHLEESITERTFWDHLGQNVGVHSLAF